jgi:CO/xanthine dehydrogenase Mo-binding subunit
MSREETFKATGPTSGGSMWVKIGAKRDGTITAAEGVFKFQAGAFPGSPVMNAAMCALAPYNIPNARTVGYDVVSNRPKASAYRAPGSPISAFAVESTLDILAKKLGMDPLQLRLKNAVRPGTTMIYGPKMSHAGYAETVEAVMNHPAYKEPSVSTRAAASPRVIGSTAAASRAPACRSTRTAPLLCRPAASISVARVRRWH